MKKIIPILLLAMIVGLFSSCIIVTTEESTPKYSILLDNQSGVTFDDWYVKDDNGDIFARDMNSDVVIYDNERQKIKDLKKGYYRLTFRRNNRYYQTDRTYLDRDITITVYSSSYNEFSTTSTLRRR